MTEYKRELELKETISIIVGKIIGSGIFKTPAPIMMLTGSISLFFTTWIVAGILTILSALIYAEMISAFPGSGGPYEILKRAYHPIIPFLRGWAMFFVSETASIVAVAIVFSEYSLKLIQTIFFIHSDAYIYSELFLVLLLIWILTLMNCIGLKFSGRFQNLLSSIKFLSLVYIVLVSFTNQPNLEFKDNSLKAEFSLNFIIVNILSSMRYALFTYSGWEGATYVAEEVKNPSRNLPLSLILGIILIIIIYLSVNLAYLVQLTPAEISNSKFVAADAMHKALGNIGISIISFIIVMNTLGNVNAQIFTKARTWHAMSRDGLFFPLIKDLNHNSIPVRSLILQGMWATILTLLAYSTKFFKTTTSVYDRLIDFFAFTSAIFNFLTMFAAWILRKKYPDIHRAFKLKFFYPIFIIVLLIYFFYGFYTLKTAFLESIAGLLLTSTGFLYYYFYIHRKKN